MYKIDNPVELRAVPKVYDEQNLVAQAQHGNRAAFSELVRYHREGVINVVYRMCGDVHLAEDAAQEAFIRAWQHLPGYQPRSPFRNWLYRIATNLALDMLRRERDMVDVDEVQLRTRTKSPEDSLDQSERAEMVCAAVLALPSASRAVLVLREYEGLSYKEIADTLGIPIGTVMSRLNYARGCLAKSLASLMDV
jgi:RNA polymerase sigma-70 factor (ECF subfamily)